MQAAARIDPKKSFAEITKGNSSTREVEEKEASKAFFYNSSKEDRSRFANIMVGVMKRSGDAFGVGKYLREEGIFSIHAIPLGPSLCLLKESIEGELKLILEEGGKWKEEWFKEIRNWELWILNVIEQLEYRCLVFHAS